MGLAFDGKSSASHRTHSEYLSFVTGSNDIRLSKIIRLIIRKLYILHLCFNKNVWLLLQWYIRDYPPALLFLDWYCTSDASIATDVKYVVQSVKDKQNIPVKYYGKYKAVVFLSIQWGNDFYFRYVVATFLHDRETTKLYLFTLPKNNNIFLLKQCHIKWNAQFLLFRTDAIKSLEIDILTLSLMGKLLLCVLSYLNGFFS